MAEDRATTSPFYRVASRAIIVTPSNKLVLVEDNEGEFQLPGGGWAHDESFEACVEREVMEELGVAVHTISPILFTYRQLDKRGYVSLRLAVRVTPESYNFTPGDDMVNVRLVTREELMDITLCPGEGPVKEFANIIWTKE